METFGTETGCPPLALGVESNNYGEVSELADEHDLGSCAARRRSSSLLFPTILGINVLSHSELAR